MDVNTHRRTRKQPSPIWSAQSEIRLSLIIPVIAAESFTLQAEEVSEVRWFDFENCLDTIATGEFDTCIYTEELEMLRKVVEN